MLGNVWEWNADPWHKNYENAPDDGRVWDYGEKVNKIKQLIRGGSFGYDPNVCRAAYRGWGTSGNRSYRKGFRVVAVARTE
jgi:formylglycine-generating enzyme required for sulfatase activity